MAERARKVGPVLRPLVKATKARMWTTIQEWGLHLRLLPKMSEDACESEDLFTKISHIVNAS